MGYLDSAGLAHFWGKVKTALAGKQNAITAGDGLSKTGDTLSISNPNRGILTQSEYDALTEEQKSSGTYFVDDGSGGGGSGSSKEVYSTEEQRIGTWIDGKPLYRLTISTTIFTGTSRSAVIYYKSDNTALNFETVTRFYGAIKGTKNTFGDINYYYTNTDWVCSKVWPAYISVTSSASSPFEANTPITISIEYTKTTDEGVTE